ncbi:MAG: LD-carboxypeptidase [Candidatus Schekmanbacteria bacterium]|nr:LD-carboxypeptidase [Candidatus Schekmanbacteria bacterium]
MKKVSQLKNGDLIALVATAGTFEKERFFKGKSLIESFGYNVCYDESIWGRNRYIAGNDKERAEAINKAFSDDNVKGIIVVRGGYGSGRALPYIDFNLIKKNPKIFCGSSDITFLHIAIQNLCGFATYYGPMPAGNNAAKSYAEEFRAFFDITSGRTKTLRVKVPDIEIIRGSSGEGRIAGGCLSIINATLGTPWEINTEGKVLFIEDIGEPPYRVDRMLFQLKMSGKLSGLQGLIVGHMVDGNSANRFEWDNAFREIILEATTGTSYPIIYGFPAGHGAGSVTIPINGSVMIDGENGFVEITDFGVKNA